MCIAHCVLSRNIPCGLYVNMHIVFVVMFVFFVCVCVYKCLSRNIPRGLYVNTHIVFVDVGVPLRLPLTGTHYPAPPTTITIVGHAYTMLMLIPCLFKAVPQSLPLIAQYSLLTSLTAPHNHHCWTCLYYAYTMN